MRGVSAWGGGVSENRDRVMRNGAEKGKDRGVERMRFGQ